MASPAFGGAADDRRRVLEKLSVGGLRRPLPEEAVACLAKYWRDVEVCSAAARAVRFHSAQPSAQAILRALGALEALVLVLDAHKSESEILIDAVEALGNLVVEEDVATIQRTLVLEALVALQEAGRSSH